MSKISLNARQSSSFEQPFKFATATQLSLSTRVEFEMLINGSDFVMPNLSPKSSRQNGGYRLSISVNDLPPNAIGAISLFLYSANA